MKFLTVASLFGASALASPATNGVRDSPVKFYANLYDNADCQFTNGATKAFLDARGSCQNFNISGDGSAKIVTRGDNNFLTAWTEPDCKGDIIFVLGNNVDCEALDGRAAQSFSDDERQFGGGN